MGLLQGMGGGRLQVARPAGPPVVTEKVIAQGLLWGGMGWRIPRVFSPLKAVCVPPRSLRHGVTQATLRSSSAARFWQGPAPTTRGDPSMLHDTLRDLSDLPRGLPLLDELSALEDRPGNSGGGSGSRGSNSFKNGPSGSSNDVSDGDRLSVKVHAHVNTRQAASLEFHRIGEIHSAGGDIRGAEERLLSDAHAEKILRKEGKKSVKKPRELTRSVGVKGGELESKGSVRELYPAVNPTRREPLPADVPGLSAPREEATASSRPQQLPSPTQPSRQFPRSEIPPRSIWPRGNFSSSGTNISLVDGSMGEVPCPGCSGRGYQRCSCTTFISLEPASNGACSHCSGMKRIPCSICEGKRVILATLQDLTSLMRHPLPLDETGDSASLAHRRASSLAEKDLLVESMVEKEMKRRKGQVQQQVPRSHTEQVQQGDEGVERGHVGASGRLSDGLIGDRVEGDVDSRDSADNSALDSTITSGVLKQPSRAGAKRGRKKPLTAEDQEKMTAAKREMREVFSLLARRRFADPELRERSMAAMKRGYEEKNAPQRISAGLKAYYASEENRKKKSELMTGRLFRCKGCGQEGHRKNFCPELGYVKRPRAGRKAQQLLKGGGRGGSQVGSKLESDDASPGVELGPAIREAAAGGAAMAQKFRTTPTPAPQLRGSESRLEDPALRSSTPRSTTRKPVQTARGQPGGGGVVHLRRTSSGPEAVGSAEAAGEEAPTRRGQRCCGVCGDRGHNRRTCTAGQRLLEAPSAGPSAAETSSSAAAAGAGAGVAREAPILALVA